MNQTKKLVLLSLLIALEVVMTGICKIDAVYLRVTLGFLPLSIIAIMFGPLYAGLACAMTDILCFFLFPTGYTFFIGFTADAFLTGLAYGIFLYKKPVTVIRILIPVCIVAVLINLGLNTYWLKILYGKGFFALLPSRLIKNITMIPVQTVLIKLTWEQLMKSGIVSMLDKKIN